MTPSEKPCYSRLGGANFEVRADGVILRVVTSLAELPAGVGRLATITLVVLDCLADFFLARLSPRHINPQRTGFRQTECLVDNLRLQHKSC